MSMYDQLLTASFRFLELRPRIPMRWEELPLEALFHLPDPFSIRYLHASIFRAHL